ncbi:MAG: phosphatase PAP2 family protein [Halobacteriaceae archaeon]
MPFGHPLPPDLQYVALIAVSSALALILGAYVYLPAGKRLGMIREFVTTDWKYLGVAWTITVVINNVAKFHVEETFTDTVHELEGSTVAVFQTVTAEPLTMLFGAVYLVGFPFIVLFTYFKLKVHCPEQARRYAIAYVCLVLIAAPFFLLFPVHVVGYEVAAVEPLLYEFHPVIEAGAGATDTLMKAFPSLHTGLSVLAAVYAQKTDRRYARMAAVMAVAIVVSTFYLGIHWLSDAGIAVVMVGIAYWISQTVERTAWRASV